jgi:hypothetical protein
MTPLLYARATAMRRRARRLIDAAQTSSWATATRSVRC